MTRQPLRRVNQFDRDPERVGQQLSQLEDNVDAAIESHALNSADRFSPTNKKTAAYTALIGELVTMDTSAASLTLTLPVASPKNAGRYVALARTSASNALTAKAPSGNVNGAASVAIAARAGLFIFLSDGAGWWVTT